MKHVLFLMLLLLVKPAWAYEHPSTRGQVPPPAKTVNLDGARAVVAFSPNGQGTSLIVKAISQARRSILVQAYGFTSAPIIRALGEAKARGVDVRAILDKVNESGRYSGATYLANHGIPVFIDSAVAIAHNKVMVIDGRAVITGSFNFTRAAQSNNAENVLLLENTPALARAYTENWFWRLRYAHPYVRDQAAADRTLGDARHDASSWGEALIRRFLHL